MTVQCLNCANADMQYAIKAQMPHMVHCKRDSPGLFKSILWERICVFFDRANDETIQRRTKELSK